MYSAPLWLLYTVIYAIYTLSFFKYTPSDFYFSIGNFIFVKFAPDCHELQKKENIKVEIDRE